MIADIDKRIRRALSGIRLPFRGRINKVNSAGPVQLVQLSGLSGETLQDNEYFQHYGLTSNPPADSMGIVLPIGGKTAHGIIIATEHGLYRLKSLKSGEVALYSDEGDHVILKRGRVMEVVTQILNITATTVVNITTPTVNMSGNLNVTGNIIAHGDISDHDNKSMAGMRTTYNGHTHNDPQGGAVSAPNQGM